MRSATYLGLATMLVFSAAAYSQTASKQTSPSSQPPAASQTKPDDSAKADSKAKPDDKAPVKAETDSIPSPGQDLDPHIKKGSEDDVNAIGTRDIGGRGLGNWHSVDWEIGTGKQYAMEIDKSTHMITDPVVNEYVNRVGQNIVKNSDCKVPFTIKIVDSDEINAMALPGGFFYVNSGLILAADEEAELAGVMAHEIAHVCAHHAAREATRLSYMQIGSIPLMIISYGSWTGYGIYEASQLAIPVTFLQFSRNFEAEADWLGLQYMYKAGYDPQAFVQFFEKLTALEKHKPGTLAKVFSDHPQTPDRIARSEEEIATILPPRPDYIVTTSEFDAVKARLARIENRRRVIDGKDGNKPTLRRTADSNNPNNPADSTDDRPTLGRRN
ncbi:M48 family metallopeptidase [Edaphobacter sp.]|uniref:M48 family metallopeptidase n=1 Tax=Edaphobacter sp. TaxID=1934404 RepID=UPI002DBBD5F9|nr:M48 family metallopeptidase [Edaphobacter sp.]HEU5341784.1 M48 family metallopeptidase [Edaphobacter sp.]